MTLLKFSLCLFLCLILNNNKVQSGQCNFCECKPNKMTFSCDCTRKTTEKNCFKERSNTITISNEELFIPKGNVNITMIEEIKIHDISIPEFDSADSEAKLESLKTFILKSCKTRYIDKNAFTKMRKLTRLEIENNNILSLENDIFVFAEKLEIIKLRSNSIGSLSEEIFKKLINLTDISLDNNNIQTLPKNLFENKNSLKYVSLSNNKIAVIEESIFSTNIKMEKIVLNHNLIQILPAGLFKNHNNLFEINLSNNKIQILPNYLFKNLSSLRVIRLENNEISLIEKDVFYNNINFEALYLKNNKLENIETNILKNSVKLRYLNLKNNLIKCDCTFIKFYTIFKTRNITSDIQCAEPNNLKDKDINILKTEDLFCPAKILNCTKIITKVDNYNNLTTFACKYYGYPKPDIFWTLNNGKLISNNNKNYNASNVETNNNNTYWSNLTIINVTTISKGMYKLDINNKGGMDTYSYYLDNNEESTISAALIFGAAGAVIIIVILLITICCICWKHKREDEKNFPVDIDNNEKIELQQIIPSQTIKPRKRSTNDNNRDLTYRRFDSYYTDMPQIIPKTDSKLNNSSEYLNGRFADTSREVNKLLRTTVTECPKVHDVPEQDKIVDEIVLPREKYETIEQWFRKSDPLNAENVKIITTETTSQNDNVPEDINNIENALKIIKRNSNFMYDAIENEDKKTFHEDLKEIEDINNNKLKDEENCNFLINEILAASVEHLDIVSNSDILMNDSTKNFSHSKNNSEAYNFEEHSSTQMSMLVEKHGSGFSFSSVSHHSKEVIEETIQVIQSKHTRSFCSDSVYDC